MSAAIVLFRHFSLVFGVSDDIGLNMKSTQPTILVLLDFLKAFDSVCHGLFILKLRQRNGFHATTAAFNQKNSNKTGFFNSVAAHALTVVSKPALGIFLERLIL
jgi:hypothetical protein